MRRRKRNSEGERNFQEVMLKREFAQKAKSIVLSLLLYRRINLFTLGITFVFDLISKKRKDSYQLNRRDTIFKVRTQFQNVSPEPSQYIPNSVSTSANDEMKSFCFPLASSFADNVTLYTILRQLFFDFHTPFFYFSRFSVV